MEVSRFRNKMVINVLGEQKRIMKAAKEKGDYSDLITNFLIIFLKTNKTFMFDNILDETQKDVVISMETED